MKHLPLFCLVLLAPVARAQNAKYWALDKKMGFRDLRFGADTSEVAGRVFVMRSNAVRYYSRPADSPLIGASEVQILYGFFKGKLYNVSLKANDIGNGQALFKALVTAYGTPDKISPYTEKYWWEGYQVFATFDSPGGNACEAIIGSRVIRNQLQAEIEGKAKQAAGNL